MFHPYLRTGSVVTGSFFSYRTTSKLSKPVLCLSLDPGEMHLPLPIGDFLNAILEIVQNSNRNNKYKELVRIPKTFTRCSDSL